MTLTSSSRKTSPSTTSIRIRPLYDSDFTFFTSPRYIHVLVLSLTLEECEIIYMTLDESSRAHASANAQLHRQCFALTTLGKQQHLLTNCRECVKALEGCAGWLRDLSDIETDRIDKVRMVHCEWLFSWLTIALLDRYFRWVCNAEMCSPARRVVASVTP
ncbi:hypothetical protein BDV97DRAFT_109712 [Delphinella strobiligena]|nr:hypothetical protein BDV97DRAFT_109712 [Delphinella strobiligena]